MGLSARALELDAKFGFSHFVQGWVLIAKGRVEEARIEFGTAIELGCDFAEADYALGETQRLLGKPAAAIESYTRSIEKAAQSGTSLWSTQCALGLVCAEICDWDGAYAAYHAALEAAKMEPVIPAQYAKLYARPWLDVLRALLR
jgi:tetratricopeptide (TPR) repeat protein